MEHKGLLPYIQQPATCPYPEPDQSLPRIIIVFYKFNFM
jgi:hypothetical protein